MVSHYLPIWVVWLRTSLLNSMNWIALEKRPEISSLILLGAQLLGWTGLQIRLNPSLGWISHIVLMLSLLIGILGLVVLFSWVLCVLRDLRAWKKQLNTQLELLRNGHQPPLT